MGLMKLWHDDIRPAPEGWVWARTNDAAKEHLLTGKVVEISMDHDLGLDGYPSAPPEMGGDFDSYDDYIRRISLRGNGPETGLDLARWMAEQGIVPEKITIHSWNPTGAKQMAQVLDDAGAKCIVAPFVPPGTVLLG